MILLYSEKASEFSNFTDKSLSHFFQSQKMMNMKQMVGNQKLIIRYHCSYPEHLIVAMKKPESQNHEIFSVFIGFNTLK